MDIPAFIWLIAFPLVASPFVYLGGRIGERLGGKATAFHLGILAFAASWIPFVLAARDFQSNGITSFTFGAIRMEIDGLSLLLSSVALGLGTLVAIYSGPYLGNEIGQEKYYAMLVAIVGVMVGLSCARDLFNLWIWFEAMAVTSYLLVAFYRDQPASLEAGLKYLVQSASGSVLVLVGVSLVLLRTGSLDLGDIENVVTRDPLLLAAGALFVIGFGVKAAIVPVHTWLPDAHSQAPSGISAMLSGVVIEAGLVAMLRPLLALAGVSASWPVLLLGFGALNIFAGNLLALRQTQVKRLLAYSSLAHLGYILLGIGITFYTGQPTGAQGGMFHLVNHGLMKGLAFLSAGVFLFTLHVAAGDHSPLTLKDLAGVSRRYPLAAFAFSIALLGLGGLPPLAGFMSKWQIFVAGFQAHNAWIAALVLFAALNSVLSLAYYAPLINAVYRLEPSPAVLAGQNVPVVMQIPLLLLMLAIVVLGIWPGILGWLVAPAGAALLGSFGG